MLQIDDHAHRAYIVARGPGELLLNLDGRAARLRVARDAGDLLVAWHGEAYRLARPAPLSADSATRAGGGHDGASLQAPMPGTLVKVLVSEGEAVREGQPLLILEAMKMEHTVKAPYGGTVRRLPFSEGSTVTGGASLIDLEPANEAG
jgi:3-methylcrotonyl-CoA carboxylase alpha subunit